MKQDCELCNLEKRTKWYFAGERFIVCECETCKVPMVVFKKHIQGIGAEAMREATKLCRLIFKERFDGFEARQRRIKDHWHKHIRLKERG